MDSKASVNRKNMPVGKIGKLSFEVFYLLLQSENEVHFSFISGIDGIH